MELFLAQDIIKVINKYSIALNLLDDYDHRRIVKPKDNNDHRVINYEDCKDIINKLKFGNDSKLFTLERNEGLKAILGAIYQSFDGKDLYLLVEEKTANPKEKNILIDLVMNFLVKDNL